MNEQTVYTITIKRVTTGQRDGRVWKQVRDPETARCEMASTKESER